MSWQHRKWLDWGIPSHVARPLAALRDRLRAHGYTVWDIGDTPHMDAEPPEDHTPYSETGWPIKTPYGWITALDVKEPDKGAGLPSLAELAGQIRADRLAAEPGVSWLKYMNWEPGDGSCWHDSWQPDYARRPSTDRGHLHLSSRSDLINSAAGDAYDPVARLHLSKPHPQEPGMLYSIVDPGKKGQQLYTDALGNPVEHLTRCLATPAGPVALEFGEIIAAFTAYPALFLPTTWARLTAICEALNPATPASKASSSSAPAKKASTSSST